MDEQAKMDGRHLITCDLTRPPKSLDGRRRGHQAIFKQSERRYKHHSSLCTLSLFMHTIIMFAQCIFTSSCSAAIASIASSEWTVGSLCWPPPLASSDSFLTRFLPI